MQRYLREYIRCIYDYKFYVSLFYSHSSPFVRLLEVAITCWFCLGVRVHMNNDQKLNNRLRGDNTSKQREYNEYNGNTIQIQWEIPCEHVNQDRTQVSMFAFVRFVVLNLNCKTKHGFCMAFECDMLCYNSR